MYISKGLQNFIYSAQENYSGGILLEIWKFVDVQDTSKKNIDLCKMKLRKYSWKITLLSSTPWSEWSNRSVKSVLIITEAVIFERTLEMLKKNKYETFEKLIVNLLQK